MKLSRRILAMVMSLMMIIASANVVVMAADEPTITLSSAQGKKGDTVDITVSLANNPGIVSMSLNVGYDASALRLTGVSDSGVMPGEMHTDVYTHNPYPLTWENDTSKKNFTVNGIVATLTFEIITEAAGSYDIKITVPQDGIYNVNVDEVNFTLVPGKVTVLSNHTHTMTHKAAKAATCVAEGNVEYWYCESCGKYFSDEAGTTEITETKTEKDPANHVGGTHVDGKLDATCGKPGKTGDTVCNSCNTVITPSTEIPATGKHTPSDKWTITDTEHYKLCSVCDEIIESTKAAHDFKWVIDKPATEDETGLRHEECETCGKTQNEGNVIPKLDHVHTGITHHPAVPATCKDTGNIEYWTCSSDKCDGKFYSDSDCQNEVQSVVTEKNPANHVGGTHVDGKLDATCGKPGKTGDTVCNSCNTVITPSTEIPATGKHTPSDKWTITDTEHYKLCSVCDEIIESTKAAHDFKWVIDKPATEDETGLRHEECETCGKTQNEGNVIPKLDHVHTGITHHPAVPATCKDTGNIEYWTCSSDKCDGKFYSDSDCQNEVQSVVTEKNPANHVGGTRVEGKLDPTCGKPGATGKTICDGCGATISESTVIPATGKHNLTKYWMSEGDEHFKLCTVCQSRIDIAAHSFIWVIDKKATEEEGGVKHEECKVCRVKRSENTEIPKLEHNISKNWNADADFHWHPCANCSTHFNEAPHNESKDWVIDKAAGSYSEGMKHKYCTICGYITVRETIPAEGGGMILTFYTINAASGEGGSISDSGKKLVPFGGNATYTFTPDAGYAVKAVIVDGENVGVMDEYTFKRISADHTISVEFEKTTWENPFIDVDENDDFFDAVRYTYENNLFKGISENEFAPDLTMTRAMFVTVLGRLADADVEKYTEMSFTDVPEGEWYSAYVEWANENAIVLGYGDGTFGPEDTITTEQAAVIISRYAEFCGIDISSDIELDSFEDADEVSDWAADAMRWAIENGVYAPEGKLDAKASASRALVAKMLYAYATNFKG